MKPKYELVNRLAGWHAVPRGRFNLLGSLSLQEFVLYEASLSFADWDQAHKQTYGTLRMTMRELETLMHQSIGFTSKHGKKLYAKKLWVKNSNGSTKIAAFELTQINTLKMLAKRDKVIDPLKYIAYSQNDFADTQFVVALRQTVDSKEISVTQGQSVADLQSRRIKSDISSYKDVTTLEDTVLLTPDHKYLLTEKDKLIIQEVTHEDPSVPS